MRNHFWSTGLVCKVEDQLWMFKSQWFPDYPCMTFLYIKVGLCELGFCLSSTFYYLLWELGLGLDKSLRVSRRYCRTGLLFWCLTVNIIDRIGRFILSGHGVLNRFDCYRYHGLRLTACFHQKPNCSRIFCGDKMKVEKLNLCLKTCIDPFLVS